MLTRLILPSARPQREQLRRGNGHDSGAFWRGNAEISVNLDEKVTLVL